LLSKLRTIFGGSSSDDPAQGSGTPEGSAPAASPRPSEERIVTRRSSGLEQFIHSIRGLPPISILDLSGANQANVSFITSLGHRLYFDDFGQALQDSFGTSHFYENQGRPERVDAFLGQTLNYEDNSFEAVLVWDNLEYLTPPLLGATMDRLYRILTPGAVLLALFHSDERPTDLPLYDFRIADPQTLQLAARGRRRPAQHFSSRDVERIFQRFEMKKFFLTREHLREVLVRK
jgi:hypothetical protein